MKSFQDFMPQDRELRLKLFQGWTSDALDRKVKRDAMQNKGKGTSGSIRIMLPSPIVDPITETQTAPAAALALGAGSRETDSDWRWPARD